VTHPMNDRIEVMAMPPEEEAVRLAEQRDAAAYVADHARDAADRDLLMDILGLATPIRTVALAATSLLLLALGHRIQTGGQR
jgi:hypothetical protein